MGGDVHCMALHVLYTNPCCTAHPCLYTNPCCTAHPCLYTNPCCTAHPCCIRIPVVQHIRVVYESLLYSTSVFPVVLNKDSTQLPVVKHTCVVYDYLVYSTLELCMTTVILEHTWFVSTSEYRSTTLHDIDSVDYTHPGFPTLLMRLISLLFHSRYVWC